MVRGSADSRYANGLPRVEETHAAKAVDLRARGDRYDAHSHMNVVDAPKGNAHVSESALVAVTHLHRHTCSRE